MELCTVCMRCRWYGAAHPLVASVGALSCAACASGNRTSPARELHPAAPSTRLRGPRVRGAERVWGRKCCRCLLDQSISHRLKQIAHTAGRMAMAAMTLPPTMPSITEHRAAISAARPSLPPVRTGCCTSVARQGCRASGTSRTDDPDAEP